MHSSCCISWLSWGTLFSNQSLPFAQIYISGAPFGWPFNAPVLSLFLIKMVDPSCYRKLVMITVLLDHYMWNATEWGLVLVHIQKRFILYLNGNGNANAADILSSDFFKEKCLLIIPLSSWLLQWTCLSNHLLKDPVPLLVITDLQFLEVKIVWVVSLSTLKWGL